MPGVLEVEKEIPVEMKAVAIVILLILAQGLFVGRVCAQTHQVCLHYSFGGPNPPTVPPTVIVGQMSLTLTGPTFQAVIQVVPIQGKVPWGQVWASASHPFYAALFGCNYAPGAFVLDFPATTTVAVTGATSDGTSCALNVSSNSMVQIPVNVTGVGVLNEGGGTAVIADIPTSGVWQSPCVQGQYIVGIALASLAGGRTGQPPVPVPQVTLTCPPGATGSATCSVSPTSLQYKINETVPLSGWRVAWNVGLQLCFDNAPCPMLTIVDQDSAAILSTGRKENITVGQQVNLLASTQSGTGTISNPQWTIPGKTVKSYTWGPATSLTTDLDLTDPLTSFYWIDGSFSGTQQVVKLSANVNGIPQSVSATINVLKPAMNSFTIQTSATTLFQPLSKPPGGMGILAGTGKKAGNTVTPGRPGSAWNASVTVPPKGSSGQLGFVQLASMNISGRCLLGQALTLTSVGVDAKTPSLPPGVYHATVPIGTGSSATISDDDNPWQTFTLQPQALACTAEVNDSFELYLMYKPSTKNAIWVTLGQATWAWHPIASKAAGQTSYKLDSGLNISSQNGQDSANLPTWSGQAKPPSGSD